MRADQIDIAYFGAFSYIVATEQGADIDAVAVYVDEESGGPGYEAYNIVAAGSDITDLDGFAGRTVCLVDPGSTSGYLRPTAGLLEACIDPEAGDVEPVFVGGHDAAVLAVVSGQCEAGFAFDEMVDTRLIDSGQLEPGAVQTVWVSETIAGAPAAVSNTLPEDLRETITTAFREKANIDDLVEEGLCDSAESCEVGDVVEEGGRGYTPVDDSEFDGVRTVCEITQAESCRAIG